MEGAGIQYDDGNHAIILMTLQRLLQDERREAKAEGKAEGKMEAFIDLYLSGDLPLSTAVSKCGLSEEEFLERTKK